MSECNFLQFVIIFPKAEKSVESDNKSRKIYLPKLSRTVENTLKAKPIQFISTFLAEMHSSYIINSLLRALSSACFLKRGHILLLAHMELRIKFLNAFRFVLPGCSKSFLIYFILKRNVKNIKLLKCKFSLLGALKLALCLH